ncbi:MAG: PHP domain-containing protein, partial [Erysipelotrichia bacterium]|nr:PHP domain-containing protein [Erysipelotrichia bacterium]
MQKFNYHTHCYRCGHAVGYEEEYMQAAIQGGFQIIGMSEHMGYEDWDDKNERLSYAEIDDYLKTMYELKEKYKDQIQVRVGFECEYFDDALTHLKAMQKKCDYLICGQHAYNRLNAYYDQAPYFEDQYIEVMAEQVCKGIKEGLFKYVAHPDYFMLSQCDFTPKKAQAIEKIAKCAKAYDVVLEINLKGTKYGHKTYGNVYSYLYPNKEVFKIIGEIGTKVCFGYDAHHPNILLDRTK